VPRLLLALGSFVRSERLKRRVPVASDLYVRRVVRDAAGRARRVRVVPYGFELPAEGADRLKRLLGEVLGEKASIKVDPAVPYGREDEWLAAQAGELTRSDQLILLFNLASTPEAENHGAMLTGLRQRLGNAVELSVLLDDSSFLHKHRGQASAARRLEERLHAWRAVLAAGGVEPVRVSLDQGQSGEGALALERALVGGAASA
jgi:hypothetical protein